MDSKQVTAATASSIVGVLGLGNMGAALVKGLLASRLRSSSQVLVFDSHTQTQEKLCSEIGAEPALGFADLYHRSAIVVLAIKPQVFLQQRDALRSVQDSSSRLIVSLMAGVQSETIREVFHHQDTVVRVMPNLPLACGEGITAIEIDGMNENTLCTVEALFHSVGKTLRVASSQMDAVTAVSGSGPMYVFEFLEGMILGGVKMGLSRESAQALALQTIKGALALINKEPLHPSAWTAKVCSPAGTTIHALHTLENGGFKGLIANAIESATLRSKELGA